MNGLPVSDMFCEKCGGAMVWKKYPKKVACSVCGEVKSVTAKVENGEIKVSLPKKYKRNIVTKSARYGGREYPEVLKALKERGFTTADVWNLGVKQALDISEQQDYNFVSTKSI